MGYKQNDGDDDDVEGDDDDDDCCCLLLFGASTERNLQLRVVCDFWWAAIKMMDEFSKCFEVGS